MLEDGVEWFEEDKCASGECKRPKGKRVAWVRSQASKASILDYKISMLSSISVCASYLPKINWSKTKNLVMIMQITVKYTFLNFISKLLLKQKFSIEKKLSDVFYLF